MMKKLIIISLVTTFLFAIANVNASSALTLIPPSFELGVYPGQSASTTIKLYNETSEAISLTTDVNNFTAQGEGGEPAFDFDSPDSGLAEWISVESGPIYLGANQRKEIPVIINAPESAEPGGHYAAVFFVDTPPDGGEGQVSIASKLGALFLIRVEGDMQEQGALDDFYAGEEEKFFSRLPIDYTVRFQNSGNVHLRPSGTITIKNMIGRETAVIDVNSEQGATLPETFRKYIATWEKEQVEEAPQGLWSKFWKGFSNEWNNFALGRYKAELELTYGTEQVQTETDKAIVWVFPWRIVILSLILVIIFILLFITILKQYNKMILRSVRRR